MEKHQGALTSGERGSPPAAASEKTLADIDLQPSDAPWLELEGDVIALRGSRCDKCGKVAFPPIRSCPKCGHQSVDDAQLPSTGVLYSFTRVHVGRPPFPPKYTLGLVDLAKSVRVLAQIDGDSLRAGLEVESYLGPISTEDSITTLSYRFRPIGDANDG